MMEIRLTIRCEKEPLKHAKILRCHDVTRQYVDNLVCLIDGTSKFYVYPPGPQSPIGKCAICGGRLECTVEEVEVPDANAKG